MKLSPREHGAYGQLGFPLATSLVLAPRGPAFLIAFAAVAFFLAHEPALVAFGRRGKSAQQQAGAAARRMLAITIAIGAALGIAGLWLAPAQARIGAAAAAALGAVLAAAIYFRIEKTLPGELLAAAAMTSAGFAAALAAGAPEHLAAQTWAAWFLGFAAAIGPVRAVVVEHKQRAATPVARIAGPLAAAAIAAAALPRGFALAASPLFVAGVVIALRPPSMKQMTRAGWILIAAGALTAMLLIFSA